MPPEKVIVTSPLLLPQEASIAVALAVGAGESLTEAEVAAVQPLASVTVTLYVPTDKLVNNCGEVAFV